MKNSILVLLFVSFTSFGQEATISNKTGDNFSLEGALDILKKSNSIEEFEKLLNKEDNNVNNLDLNNDGNIDYISVNDIQEGDTHVLVLSTYLNENEKQDIATIGIEKTGTENATLQIEGDTDLYSENTIAEPFETIQSAKVENKSGPNSPEIILNTVLVNIWFWPSIRFIYGPRYVAYHSSFRWGFYPIWWKPWHPYRYSVFYTRCAPSRVYFRRVPVRTVLVAHRIYAPRRNRSIVLIQNRRGETTIIRKNNQISNNRFRNFHKVRVNQNFRSGRGRR